MHTAKVFFRKYHVLVSLFGAGLICAAMAFSSAGFLSCTRQVQALSKEDAACARLKEGFPKQGWLDDNTYQLTSFGVKTKNIPKEKIKASVCHAAMMNCKYYFLMEKLSEKYNKRLKELYGEYECVEWGEGNSFDTWEWLKELKRILKSGVVVDEKFDDPVCAVTVRVSKEGLKQWSDDLAKVLDTQKPAAVLYVPKKR